jgi:hypothetical protein
MKFLTALLLTALAGYAACSFSLLPWWSFVPTSFLIALVIPLRPGRAWVAGFAGIFLLWFLLELVIDIRNNSILSVRMAHLLPLNGNRWLLMLAGSLAGGLLGGLAALSGSLLRKPAV